MTMIAYAFLQDRRLAQAGRKKESTVHRLSRACRPYAKPSSISSFSHHLTDARNAEDKSEKSSCVNKSAKVVLGCPFYLVFDIIAFSGLFFETGGFAVDLKIKSRHHACSGVSMLSATNSEVSRLAIGGAASGSIIFSGYGLQTVQPEDSSDFFSE